MDATQYFAPLSDPGAGRTGEEDQGRNVRALRRVESADFLALRERVRTRASDVEESARPRSIAEAKAETTKPDEAISHGATREAGLVDPGLGLLQPLASFGIEDCLAHANRFWRNFHQLVGADPIERFFQ